MASRKKRKRILAEEIAGITLIAVAILLGMEVYASGGGLFGDTLRRICLGILGCTAYILPGVLFVLGVYVLIYADKRLPFGKTLCWAIIVLCLISILHLLYNQRLDASSFSAYISSSYEMGINDRIAGGALGALVTFPVQKMFGIFGTYIVSIAAIVICLLISTNLSIRSMHDKTSQRLQNIRANSVEKRERKQEIRNHRLIDRAGQGQTKGGLHIFTVQDEDDSFNSPLSPVENIPRCHTRREESSGMRRSRLCSRRSPIARKTRQSLRFKFRSLSSNL